MLGNERKIAFSNFITRDSYSIFRIPKLFTVIGEDLESIELRILEHLKQMLGDSGVFTFYIRVRQLLFDVQANTPTSFTNSRETSSACLTKLIKFWNPNQKQNKALLPFDLIFQRRKPTDPKYYQPRLSTTGLPSSSSPPPPSSSPRSHSRPYRALFFSLTLRLFVSAPVPPHPRPPS
mmetsp:Transcript_18137/g.72608  ORF Transcript_18137/g.72608 Transcript_18137/m.72608 type:complete len:178 (-) Transcript_18137:237-770(-)